jgi:hypothetical protein
MATIKELLQNITDNADGEQPNEDSLVGQLAGGDAKSWQPSDETREVAKTYGYCQGFEDFYRLPSPAGRTIGFPFPEARVGQLEAVDQVLDAFAAGYDVLLDAPTGAGKSPIEIGVVTQFESAYLLIGRNDLVDQWEGDFEKFGAIGFYKARQRFDCEVIMGEGKRLNCSQAKSACNHARKEAKNKQKSNAAQGNYGGTHCPACPYAVNRDMSLAKPYTVMTLSLGLTIFKYMSQHPGVTKRDVLIIDECSELESEIMKFFSFEASTKTVFRAISKSIVMSSFFPEGDEFYSRWPNVSIKDTFGDALPKMKPFPTLASCSMWAIEIASMAATRLNWVKVRHQGEDASEDQEKIEDACEKLIRMSKNMMDCIGDKIPHFAEISPGEDKTDQEQYTIKVAPLEARGMLERLAAPFANRLMFVSATTGTAEMFKAAHGYTRPMIKVNGTSTFPVANRMIYSMRAGNMSAKSQVQDAPAVMKALVTIATSSQPLKPKFDHVNQKGIIHTYNNKITEMVMQALQAAGLGNRAIPLKGGGKSREIALDTFRRAKQPLILVSPSAMLGLSLNDDLGRWQAIVKVPYAFLGDPSIVHRKDNINGWYEWQTAKDLIQTFGRIVRSETDWGQTYVLDDAFSRFYAQNWHLFPTYIQEAIWQKPQ